MRALIGMIVVLGIVGGAAFAFLQSGSASLLLEDVQATEHGDGMLQITMTLENGGDPDTLIAVSSPETKGGGIVSRDGSALPVPKGASVSLSADGAYLMLAGVEGDLAEGRLVPLSLTFANAGTVTAKARITKPMAMAHGAMGMGYDVPSGEPAPRLSIETRAFMNGGWSVSAKTDNFQFSQEAADGPHEPGIGHAHLYVGGVKIRRLYAPDAALPSLPPGEHIVRVTLNTNDHRTYRVGGKPVTATAIINVPLGANAAQ